MNKVCIKRYIKYNCGCITYPFVLREKNRRLGPVPDHPLSHQLRKTNVSFCAKDKTCESAILSQDGEIDL